MPQIFIPKLGDTIELEDDWRFWLFDDHRNDSLQKNANLYPPYRNREGKARSWDSMSLAERAAEIDDTDWVYERPAGWTQGDYWTGEWSMELTLRAGTHLRFDQYRIRRGQPFEDAISFTTRLWVSCPGDPTWKVPRKVKSMKFFAKLDDVNRILGKKVVVNY